MLDPRLQKVLAALVPGRVATDAFEPAWEDLRFAYLTRRVRLESPVGRIAHGALYLALALLLVFDCWRLAAVNLVRRRDRGAVPPTHPIPTEPRQTERFAMFLYLVRHAFRQLGREPAFTVAAVLTLALGVGANVAVFAVVEAVLLRPLPYANADQLVILNHRDQRTGITKEFIAIGDYVDLVDRQTAFEAISAYGHGQTAYIDGDRMVRVELLGAGPGLLELLRIRPVLGRTFRAEDSRQGAPPVMMLSYEMWQNQFGGDPSVIGRTLRFEQTQRQVVGITPAGFTFPPTATTDMLVPLTLPTVAPANRRAGWTFAIGRLAPGRTLDDAATNLTLLSRQMETEFPQSNLASEYYPLDLRTALAGNTKPALMLLFAAVGVVLLIACANVANLLLARSLGRRREMSVRLALGAGGTRLAAQLLTESLVLALVASLGGVLMAYWGARALVALLPQSGSVPGLDAVRINGSVLAFTLGIIVLTTIVFGLVSALSVRSQKAVGVLNASRGSSMSPRVRRATSTLVVVEVALAIVLLVGAGLILRSFASLLAVDPGFRTADVMTMTLQLPASRYAERAARDAFYQRAFAEMKSVPGVREVGAAAVTPLTGNNWTAPFERPEQPVPAGERPPEVGWQLASNGYFKALQIPLIDGRLFDERDTPERPAVVIISDAIQKRFFPNERAVGKHVRQGDQTAEIVGVVGNIRRAGLRDEPRADMYFPFETNKPGQISLFVRTSGNPERSISGVDAAIERIEPYASVTEGQTLSHVASESERVTRVVLWLLGVFAVTSLALAAIGIYGVMSYAVRQRTREIGTRIALGATRRNIVWLVLQQGAVIAAIGTVVGLATGLATTRFLNSILYGVSGTDPITLSAAVTLLVVTIMLACYVPARRAASVDPAKTLADQ
ncbi:MAG TPA: ABC transporter permease [Gemmatimonadaceae bacterium]|jgi:predicted permease|nr:ABC transporter permease [Gemmatimonadaceae bacterium]